MIAAAKAGFARQSQSAGGYGNPLRVPMLMGHKGKPRSGNPTGASRNSNQLAGEDTVQLLLDLPLVGLGRYGNFFDQKGTGGVEHLALAKG